MQCFYVDGVSCQLKLFIISQVSTYLKVSAKIDGFGSNLHHVKSLIEEIDLRSSSLSNQTKLHNIRKFKLSQSQTHH